MHTTVYFSGNLIWNKCPAQVVPRKRLQTKKQTSSCSAVEKTKAMCNTKFYLWVQTGNGAWLLILVTSQDFHWKKTCAYKQGRNCFVLKGLLQTQPRQGTQTNLAAPSLLESLGNFTRQTGWDSKPCKHQEALMHDVLEQWGLNTTLLVESSLGLGITSALQVAPTLTITLMILKS